MDIITAGNIHDFEAETPNSDAGIGTVMHYRNGKFEIVDNQQIRNVPIPDDVQKWIASLNTENFPEVYKKITDERTFWKIWEKDFYTQ